MQNESDLAWLFYVSWAYPSYLPREIDNSRRKDFNAHAVRLACIEWLGLVWTWPHSITEVLCSAARHHAIAVLINTTRDVRAKHVWCMIRHYGNQKHVVLL